MKELNTAQKLLAAIGIPFVKEHGKNPSNTKAGPGRRHKQGYIKKK